MTVTFAQTAGPYPLLCTGGGCDRQTNTVVIVDGMWDGNAVCDSAACVAEAIAEFGQHNDAAPWEPDWEDGR